MGERETMHVFQIERNSYFQLKLNQWSIATLEKKNSYKNK